MVVEDAWRRRNLIMRVKFWESLQRTGVAISGHVSAPCIRRIREIFKESRYSEKPTVDHVEYDHFLALAPPDKRRSAQVERFSGLLGVEILNILSEEGFNLKATDSLPARNPNDPRAGVADRTFFFAMNMRNVRNDGIARPAQLPPQRLIKVEPPPRIALPNGAKRKVNVHSYDAAVARPGAPLGLHGRLKRDSNSIKQILTPSPSHSDDDQPGSEYQKSPLLRVLAGEPTPIDKFPNDHLPHDEGFSDMERIVVKEEEGRRRQLPDDRRKDSLKHLSRFWEDQAGNDIAPSPERRQSDAMDSEFHKGDGVYARHPDGRISDDDPDTSSVLSDDLSRKEGTIRRISSQHLLADLRGEGNKPYLDVLEPAAAALRDFPGQDFQDFPGCSSPPGEQPGAPMTGHSYFDSGEDWPSVAIPEPDDQSDHGQKMSSQWISGDHSSKVDHETIASSKFKGHPKAKSSLMALNIPLPPKKKHSGKRGKRSIDSNITMETEDTTVIDIGDYDNGRYDKNLGLDEDRLALGLNLPRRKKRHDTGTSLTSNPNRDHEPNSNQRAGPRDLSELKARLLHGKVKPRDGKVKNLPSKSRRSTEEDLERGGKKKKSKDKLDHLATSSMIKQSINIAKGKSLQSQPSSSDQHSRNHTSATNPNDATRIPREQRMRKESDLFDDDYSGSIPATRSPELEPRDIFGQFDKRAPKGREKGAERGQASIPRDIPREVRPNGSRAERPVKRRAAGKTAEILLNGAIRALANEHFEHFAPSTNERDEDSMDEMGDLSTHLMASPRPARRPRKFTGSADIDVSGVGRSGSLRLDDSSIAQLEELEKLRGTTPERLDLSGDHPVKVPPGQDPPSIRSVQSSLKSPTRSLQSSLKSPHSGGGGSNASSGRDGRRASDASRPYSWGVTELGRRPSSRPRKDPVGRRSSVGNRPRRTVALRSPTTSMRTFPFKAKPAVGGMTGRERSGTDPTQRRKIGGSRSSNRVSRVVNRSRTSSRRTAVSSIGSKPSIGSKSKNGSTGSSTGSKSTKINPKFKPQKGSLSDRWGSSEDDALIKRLSNESRRGQTQRRLNNASQSPSISQQPAKTQTSVNTRHRREGMRKVSGSSKAAVLRSPRARRADPNNPYESPTDE